MASSSILGVLVAVVLVSSGVSSAQMSLCGVPFSGLMACKPAVTLPNPVQPTGPCCTALSHADFKCLCSYKNSDTLPSLGIDPTLAFQLPQKCKLSQSPNCA